MANFAEFLAKLSSDKDLLAKFRRDPKGTLEKAGLSKEQVSAVVKKDQAAIEAQLRDEIAANTEAYTISITINIII
jgi:hypothetical protein